MIVGMHATVSFAGGELDIALCVDRNGQLTEAEKKARDIMLEDARNDAGDTAEMDAALLENLVALIPIRCAGCGRLKDVAALVAEIRKGAVLS